MNQPALDRDTELMSAFVSEHGQQALEPNKETVERAPRAESPADLPEPEDELELDSATLQALGLEAEEKESSDSDGEGEEEGAGGEEVDLQSLAKTLGLDPDDLSYGKDGVKLKTKVDGERGEVSLSELRKGYQLQSHFTKQQEQFLAEKQVWEQVRQREQAKVQEAATLAMQVLEQEERQLKAAYTRDWTALRQEDPAEYAAQVAEYNQKLSELRGRQQHLASQWQQHQQETQARQQQQDQERVALETQAFLQATGWKGENAQANSKRLGEYLNKQGFSDAEIGAVRDHKAFLIAEKARLYDVLMSKVDLSRKKSAAPHVMPSGAAAPKIVGGSKKRARDKAVARVRSEGSVDSAAEAFSKLGII